MWVKYVGEIPYNRVGLMGVLPKSKIEVSEKLGKLLIKEHPKWFKPCSKPIIMKSKEESKDEPKEETKEKEEVKRK